MSDGGRDHGELAAALAVAVRRFDAVPPAVLASAKESFTWRTIDAELAVLSGDSLIDDSALVGVRGRGPRSVTFEAEGVVLDLEIVEQQGTMALRGQVVAEALDAVELQSGDDVSNRSVGVDALGRFRADVPPGPMRVWCRFGGAAPRVVATEWVVV